MAGARPARIRFNRYLGPWDAFRRWRRSRPFWGGLLTGLAGLEIFGTTQMSFSNFTLQLGPTGFLSWLIPVLLVTCGLLMWITPQQRILYAVIAVVAAVYSLIGVNLGGFLLGAVLGTIGSGLGFAWMPGRQPVGHAPSDGVAADDGSDADGGPEPATSTDDRADGDLAVDPDQAAPAAGDTASPRPGAGNRPSRDG